MRFRSVEGNTVIEPNQHPDVGVMLPMSGAVAKAGRFEVAEAAQLAEDLGFTSVWVGDHLAFHVPVLEAIVAATAASVAAQEIQIGFAVMLLALRHPTWTAKQLTSLQALTGDRLILGVGVGGENPDEWAAAAVPVSERGRRTDTLLTVLPELLSGAAAKLPAPFDVSVPPLQPAGAMPPVWIGGRSDVALERAAQFADGWLGMWVDPARIRRVQDELARRARAHRRTPPNTGVLVFCSLDHNEEQAHRAAAQVLESQYRLPYTKMRRYVAAGSPQQVEDHLHELVSAGAHQLVLFPADPDWRAAYHGIAEIANRL